MLYIIVYPQYIVYIRYYIYNRLCMQYIDLYKIYTRYIQEYIQDIYNILYIYYIYIQEQRRKIPPSHADGLYKSTQRNVCMYINRFIYACIYLYNSSCHDISFIFNLTLGQSKCHKKMLKLQITKPDSPVAYKL